MANIVIGYNNLVPETTVTPGSEAAGFDADNLKVTHPTVFWRTSNMTTTSARFTFSTEKPWNLVAPLYATVAPHKNFLKNANNWTAADWTTVSLTVTTVSGEPKPPPGLGAQARRLIATGSGLHYIRQDDVLAEYTSWEQETFSAIGEVYVKQAGGGAHVRVRIGHQGHYAAADVNLTTGAVNGTSDLGSHTVGTPVVTTVGDYYKIVVPATVASTATSTGLWVFVLKSDFSDSYTVGSEQIDVSAPQVVIGASTSSGRYDPTLTERGAVWKAKQSTSISSFVSGDTSSGWLPFAASATPQDFADTYGYLHSWHLFSDVLQGPAIVEIHDGGNADSFLEVSNVYVGMGWQPSINIRDDDFTILPWDMSPRSIMTPTGQEYTAAHNAPRTFSMVWRYASKSDALGDFASLSAKVGKHSPIVVIVDPDESEYGQELVIYGRPLDLQIVALPYSAKTNATGWGIRLSVRELLP